MPDGGTSARKHILLLNSYHQHYAWTEDLVRGVESALHAAGQDAEFYVEYMDTKRYYDEAYLKQLYELYARKYRNLPLDVIISSDDNAYEFLKEYHSRLFPTCPVVFCGLNNQDPTALDKNDLFTGIMEVFDADSTLATALRLHPGTRRVVLINDTTTSGRAISRVVRDVAGKYEDRVEFTWIEDVPAEEMLRQVKALPPDSLVLYMVFFRDGQDRYFPYSEILPRISKASPVPVYGLWAHYLGYGIVGGRLNGGYFQGEKAGQMAVEILRGKPVREIPVVRTSLNHFMFDDNQLKRWHIPRSALPPDSILINEPTSFYSRYKTLIWAVVAFIVVETLIIVGLLLNIARRRRAERSLRESEERFQSLLAAVPDIFMVIGPDGRHLEIYTSKSELLTAPAAEMVGRTVHEVVPEPVARKAQEVIADVIASGELRGFEYPLETAGKARWFSSRVAPFTWRGQTATLWVVRDVTERKVAEEALRQERDFANGVVETAHAIVLVLDTDGRVARINRFGQQLLGYSQPQMRGATWTETYVAPEAREDSRRVIAGTLAGHPASGSESRILARDGREILVLWYGAPLRDAKGRVTGVLGIGHDITELRSTEEQLRQAQKMEAVGRLAGGIAHDFNNQLTVITGYCEMLLQEPSLDEALGQALRDVQAAAHRAADLTGQLLAFSRRQLLRPKVIDLNSVLAEMAAPLQRMIGEHIRLSLVPAKGSSRVKADPVQVQQALLNLATNARDAMPDGGSLTIEIADVHLDRPSAAEPAAGPGDYVMLAVTDTGVGMDAATLQRIFEPFFTTKPVGEGTGLGLAMVYGFVKQSRGYVQANSRPGHGTTVQLYLPQVGSVAQPTEEVAAEPFVKTGTEAILLVEDEQSVRSLIVVVLRRAGYHVLETANANEALAVIGDLGVPVQLVITDVVMPGRSGPELAAEVRRLRPEVPVLFITGYARNEFIADGDLRSGDNLLAKPFRPAELLSAVRRALDAMVTG